MVNLCNLRIRDGKISLPLLWNFNFRQLIYLEHHAHFGDSRWYFFNFQIFVIRILVNIMEVAQTRSSHTGAHVQKATLETTVKPTSMNVTLNSVGMVELVKMVSIATSASVQKATLGKTVKVTSMDVDPTPANMMHSVPKKTKGTGVTVHLVTLESTVKLMIGLVMPCQDGKICIDHDSFYVCDFPCCCTGGNCSVETDDCLSDCWRVIYGFGSLLHTQWMKSMLFCLFSGISENSDRILLW